MDGQEPTTNNGQEPNANHAATDKTPDANGQPQTPPDNDANAPVEVSKLPANVQKLISDLRDENASHRKTASDAKKTAQEAHEKQLQEQEEWRKLAEERGTQVKDLSGKAELYDKISPVLDRQLQAEIEAWPENVRNILPPNLSVVDKLEWAERLRPLAAERMGDKPPTPGNSRGPKPASNAVASKAEDDAKAKWRSEAMRKYR
jgi:hypothetical protein